MGMRAWVQGDSASPVRGACSRGMVFTSPALPDTPQTLLRESSRPCFARDAANGASTDTQELPAPPILPWAHCGTEADGKVGTLELELACAASLRAPPLLLARALTTVASPARIKLDQRYPGAARTRVWRH